MPEYISRYIEKTVLADLERKMVFIGGPRQSGKTTLAKHICMLFGCEIEKWYLSWDAAEDRERIIRETFPTGAGVLILDEIHKYSRWRQVVKGLYDKRGHEIKILVTGSARLDLSRRGGDSLQGRYHFYRLLPFTCGELAAPPGKAVSDLMLYGAFPEPFLLASEMETRRWSRDYRTRVIHGDLSELENVQDLSLIESLVLRLPELVGAPLSINALREDLQVSHQSVSRWIAMLENLYMIFRIYPFGSPKIRAVKKEAKHYHLDWTVVKDAGARFENLVACHLLKWCFFLQDSEGRDIELRYFRDTDKREVDFVIVEDNRPTHLIECKTSRGSASSAVKYLKGKFPECPATQLVLENEIDVTTGEGVRICSASRFLAGLI